MKKILVIDDDPALQDMLTLALEADGFGCIRPTGKG